MILFDLHFHISERAKSSGEKSAEAMLTYRKRLVGRAYCLFKAEKTKANCCR